LRGSNNFKKLTQTHESQIIFRAKRDRDCFEKSPKQLK